MVDTIDDFYPAPNRAYILVGASGSGKTTWAVSLINQFLEQGVQFSKCMIFYEVYQNIYDKINMPINAYEGLQDLLMMPDNSYEGALVVIDDQQLRLKGDYMQSLNRLFTVIAHHKKCTIMLLLQNLFTDESQLKTVYKNAAYITVFASRHSMQLLTSLQRMFFVGARGLLNSAAEHAFRYHQYVLLDMITHTPYAIKTGVLDDGNSFVYKITNVCTFNCI